MIVDENGIGQQSINAAALMGMFDEGNTNDEASQSTTATSPSFQGVRGQADTNKRRLDNMSDTETIMSPPAKRQRLAMPDQISTSAIPLDLKDSSSSPDISDSDLNTMTGNRQCCKSRSSNQCAHTISMRMNNDSI